MMNEIGLALFTCAILLCTRSSKRLDDKKSGKNKNVIYIYHDEGVGDISFSQLHLSLLNNLPPSYNLQVLNAMMLLEGKWIDRGIAFFMPGGADLLYASKLNGRGNQLLRDFVQLGGRYIGICAGAYYGSAYCEFHRGDTRGYEVLGSRELAFFPGSAVGPVLANYNYGDDSGARVAKIQLELTSEMFSSYVNGGCYFANVNSYDNIKTLATYQNSGKSKGEAAIIEAQIGNGLAILSGVHFEFNNSFVEKLQRRYLSEEVLNDNPHRTNDQLLTWILQRLL